MAPKKKKKPSGWKRYSYSDAPHDAFRCKAIRARGGNRCKNQRLDNSDFCGHHHQDNLKKGIMPNVNRANCKSFDDCQSHIIDLIYWLQRVAPTSNTKMDLTRLSANQKITHITNLWKIWAQVEKMKKETGDDAEPPVVVIDQINKPKRLIEATCAEEEKSGKK